MYLIKPNVKIALAFCLLAAVVLLMCAYSFKSTEVARAGGYSIACTDLTRPGLVNNGCVTNGTTTPTFLTAAAATTTFTALIPQANSVSLNLQVAASSTSSVITFRESFSYNGIDWYQEDLPTTSGAVTTHPALGITHTWTPGTVATTSRSLNLQTHAAKYVQIGFQATGANASIYPQLIIQNAPIN